MKIFVLLFALAGCGEDALKPDCNPNIYPDDCSAGNKCNAANKKCEPAVSCSSETDCGTYACTISDVCNRNCTGQGMLPDNSLCGSGSLCNKTTRQCEKVTTCDPAAANPCNGLTCDATTKTCG